MNEKILLVDDEVGIRKFLGIYLTDMGFEVATAENGRQALEVFETFDPAIVLTDIKMPVMDGIELLKALKARAPDTEVIMISGHGDLDLAIESLKHRAADFVTKPVNHDMLEAALRNASEKAAMRRELRRHTAHLGEMVREKTALHQELFDAAPCAIAVIDREQMLVSANRQFRDQFGEPGGRTCYQAFRHRQAPCGDCKAMQTFDDGVSRETETVVTTADGTHRNVLIRTAPIRDAAGEIVQVMEMATDITTVRRLQCHLTDLGLMVGSMSHGVKGMLTALDGGMYRLESGIRKADMEQVASATAAVGQMVGRIKSMVLDILYYAKSRALELETSDVEVFAEHLAALVKPRADLHKVRFMTDIASELDTFLIDVKAVSSALVNFLENAVDACIADRTKQAHTVVLSVSGDHEWVVFDIHDNGTGIDQETLDRMFTLFFSSKGSKGTGLGLYIANKVVRQHGGSIAVDSTPGQGTNFTIRLPREVPPECLRGEDPDEIAAAANEEPGTAEKTAAPKAGAPGNGKGDRPYCAWIGDMADDE